MQAVVATTCQSVAPLDDTDASFASRPPLLALFEPALLFPSAPLFTARVPIRNRNILHAQRLSSFFIGPRAKTGVGRHPSRNPASLAAMRFHARQSQVPVGGALPVPPRM